MFGFRHLFNNCKTTNLTTMESIKFTTNEKAVKSLIYQITDYSEYKSKKKDFAAALTHAKPHLDLLQQERLPLRQRDIL